MDTVETPGGGHFHRDSHDESSSFIDDGDDDEDANANANAGDGDHHECTTERTPTRPTNTTGDSRSSTCSVLPSRRIPSISELKRLIMMWKKVDGTSASDAVESVHVIIRNLETLLEYLETAAAANDNNSDDSDTIRSKETTARLLLLQQPETVSTVPGQQQQQQHQQQQPRHQNLSRESSGVDMSPRNNDVTARVAARATSTATRVAGTLSAGDDGDDDEDDASMSSSQDCRGEEENANNNSNEDRRRTVQFQPTNAIATTPTEKVKKKHKALPHHSEESSQNCTTLEEPSQQQQQEDSSSLQPYYESQQSTTSAYSNSFPSPWDSQFDYNNKDKNKNKNNNPDGDDCHDHNDDHQDDDDDDDDDDENAGIGSSIDSQYLPQSCDFDLLGRGWDNLARQSSSQGRNDNDDDASSSSSEEVAETKQSTETSMDVHKEERAYKNDDEKSPIVKPTNSDRQDENNSPPMSEPSHERFTTPAKHVSTLHAERKKKNSELTSIFKDSTEHSLQNITPYSTMTAASANKSIASHDTSTTEPLVLRIICEKSVTNDKRDRLRSLEDNGWLSIVHESALQQSFDVSSPSSSILRSSRITPSRYHHDEDFDTTVQRLDNKSDFVLFVGTTQRPCLLSSQSASDSSSKSVFVCERTYLYYLCRAMGCLVVSSDLINDLEEQRRGGQTVFDFHDMVLKYQVWGDNGLYEQMTNTSNNYWPTQWRDPSILSTTRLSPSSFHNNMLADFNVIVVNADETDDTNEDNDFISSSDEAILISQENDDRLSSGPTKDEIETLCRVLGANIVQDITDQSEIESTKASTRSDLKTIVLISPTVENISSLIHSLTTEQNVLSQSWKRKFVSIEAESDSRNDRDQQGFHCPSSVQFLYNLWVMDAISAGCLPPMNHYAVGRLKR